MGVKTSYNWAGVNADLANIARYLNTPVATYTHSGNKECVVSAVDVGTDTFTSVGHTLVNGDIIHPIANSNAGLIYPNNVVAGGITNISGGYYVINKTADTFQVSLTSGGAAVDITANANLDLTKWHFEQKGPYQVTINNLLGKYKYRVKLKGRGCPPGTSLYIHPNNIAIAQEWIFAISTGGTSLSYTYDPVGNGDIWNTGEVLIDYSSILSLNMVFGCIRSKTTTQNENILTRGVGISPKYSNALITRIDFIQFYPANGTVIEVYDA